MGSKLEDEDYWNTSDSKAFSFDETEFSSKSTLFDSGKGNSSKVYHEYGGLSKTSGITDAIFEGIPLISKERVERSLGSLIPPLSLNQILGEEPAKPSKPSNADEEIRILRRQIENQWVPANASKTVKSIMLGQPYSLHLYRSLELKTQLVDEAIKCGDGNAILAVVLFLNKTLKKSLFHQLLQSRPPAVAHYVQYLSTRLHISELTDMLEMLGHNRDASMKQLKFSITSTQNVDRKLQKLKMCYSNHFSMPDAKDKQFVVSFISYLEWLLAAQRLDSSVPPRSVLSSLSHICKSYWNEPKANLMAPSTLRIQQEIVERQYEWTVLTTRASLGAWEDIETLFVTKGWLGGKKLKSVISIDRILLELERHDPPSEILTQYLDLVDNLEKRLELAKRLSCHKTIIDVYVLMKDRQGLVEYKANLNPQLADYIHAENSLRAPVKWKN